MTAPNLITNEPIDNLRLAFEHVCRNLAQVTRHPMPTYEVGGRTVSTAQYMQMLIEQRAMLKRAIQDEQAPFTIITRGY